MAVAELPHHAIFVGLAEFFGDFRREKRGVSKALPPQRAAEFAGGAGGYGKDGGKHYNPTVTCVLSRIVCG